MDKIKTLIPALLGVLAAGQTAHAQSFTYSTTFTPTSTTSGSSTLTNSSALPTFASADTAIVLANFSTGQTGGPGNLSTDSISQLFTLGLTLSHDFGGGNIVSQTQSFTGNLAAVISQNGVQSNIAFATNPFSTFDLGNGQRFNVFTDPSQFSGLSATGSSSSIGSLGATVQFVTPEPGSFGLLFGIGASGSLLALKRRRSR